MKRLFTWIAALVALAVVGNTFMAMYVSSQQSARLAAIRAAGLPASIAELRPAPIPDSLNAAAVIESAAPAIQIPDDDPETSPALRLKFKYYQRVEGRFKVPEGSRVTAVAVRLYESGQAAPRATRTLSLS